MLQHVYERASMARYLTSTIIATDDQRVFDAARAFGAPVRMTRSDHISGTDRVAEVASAENAAIIVNIQADEPLIDPAAIDAAILPVAQDAAIVMSTLKKRIEDTREIGDPNVVKVVANHAGDAIYFSRSPIPYCRERGSLSGSTNDPPGCRAACFKHIGLYVYQRDFLLNYSLLPVGPLEQAERLEQLRALENGYSIRVVETEYESFGVDTPEDLERVSRLFEATVIPKRQFEANNLKQQFKATREVH
jgi:3-deoxy-manno-octulosonate cytidylyltransferase (CMP-KDO synthetase)